MLYIRSALLVQRMSASTTPEFRPELARRHDAQASGGRHRQEVGIAGNEYVRLSGPGVGLHSSVGAIADRHGIHRLGLWDHLIGAQKSFDLIDPLDRKVEPRPQHTPEFREHDFPDDDLMFCVDTAQ